VSEGFWGSESLEFRVWSLEFGVRSSEFGTIVLVLVLVRRSPCAVLSRIYPTLDIARFQSLSACPFAASVSLW